MDRTSAIARIRVSRARSRRSSRRDQHGFVLLAVLGVILFVSLVGAAILSMTMLSGNVVANLASTTESTRQFDGALASAVAWFRTNGPSSVDPNDPIPVDCATQSPPPFTPGANPSGDPGNPSPPQPYTFTCTSPTAPTLQSRVLDIAASDPSGFVVGRARVRFTDQANGLPLDGYTVEVCDWQLGSSAVNEALDGCS
jgi:type II secretory pathway pseudopilin PulG